MAEQDPPTSPVKGPERDATSGGNAKEDKEEEEAMLLPEAQLLRVNKPDTGEDRTGQRMSNQKMRTCHQS